MPHFTVINQAVVPMWQNPEQSLTVCVVEEKSHFDICHFAIPPTEGTAKHCI